MGSEISGNGNVDRATDDGDADCVYAWRGAAVWRRIFLLSRAELWRHSHDVHEAAELCRARQFLPHSLRRDDGAVAVLVSQELLLVLHVGRVGDLSGAGLRSIFQAGSGRTSLPTKSTRTYHRRVHAFCREASRSWRSLYAHRFLTGPGARLGDD